MEYTNEMVDSPLLSVYNSRNKRPIPDIAHPGESHWNSFRISINCLVLSVSHFFMFFCSLFTYICIKKIFTQIILDMQRICISVHILSNNNTVFRVVYKDSISYGTIRFILLIIPSIMLCITIYTRYYSRYVIANLANIVILGLINVMIDLQLSLLFLNSIIIALIGLFTQFCVRYFFFLIYDFFFFLYIYN